MDAVSIGDICLEKWAGRRGDFYYYYFYCYSFNHRFSARSSRLHGSSGRNDVLMHISSKGRVKGERDVDYR